ncbi:hypothetical protein P171DRAFT_497714 [Karstenula rhodostoma CBS 690.94]|uniref:Uncharacterized protein n=1 Tax=Karstenula rhodostoma CBS 690.94 TaxID=1392251 RepID=A0A9P4PCI4_9PLEO|nr:hypothetical protein P171DRAFT_497714 [Karstenula rhodostoma CBS 690.94]
MTFTTNSDKPDAKTTPNDRASIVSSAKMHLGISLAQVIHLKETDAVPKEISDAITLLHDTITKPSAAVPPSASFEIQSPPVSVPVTRSHMPGNHNGVVARPGDRVIVYGWAKNGSEAIAYNARNDTTGRIPTLVLDVVHQEPVETKLYMVAADQPFTSELKVTLKAGDFIRMWNCVHGPNVWSGMCFNLASGQIGKYSSLPMKFVE